MAQKFIVTNFAYGTGPYLMTAKLAVAFNDELERVGHERLGIIVPWVYGEKQKKIMAEEGLISDEIILDEGLGEILKKVFYENESFEDYLKRWVDKFEAVSAEAHKYLKEKYGDKIVVELNRSPRLTYGVAPAYFSSFGLLSRVFGESTKATDIKIKKELLEKAANIHREIEQSQELKCVGYPGLFSDGAISVPPICPITKEDVAKYRNNPVLKNVGIFVTKTGIPNQRLRELYHQARLLNFMYMPDNDSASPHLIENQSILFHFARSGWASVWRSMIAEKPLIVPEYDSNDDPEIYFNNQKIEELGIGMVYRGGGLGAAMDKRGEMIIKCQEINEKIKNKWGTFDGTKFVAKLFAEDFLKN